MPSPSIDLTFPILGEFVPLDHGYALYSSLSQHIAALHEPSTCWAIGPVGGRYAGRNLMALVPGRSRLRLRLPGADIPRALVLSGKALDIGGHRVRLGVPTVHALVPASALVAKIVTIKGFTEPESFLDAARRQLQELGGCGETAIPAVSVGPREGEPRRRIIAIKGKRVVGFCLQVIGLSPEDSLQLQERGIGGRRKMGCGFFVGVKQKGPS